MKTSNWWSRTHWSATTCSPLRRPPWAMASGVPGDLETCLRHRRWRAVTFGYSGCTPCKIEIGCRCVRRGNPMRRPPARVIDTVLAVAVLAIIAFGAAVAFAPVHMRLTTWIVAGEIVIALLVAWLAPVLLATKTSHYVNTTAFLLATVLLPLPLAMAGVAVTCIAADARRRVAWSASGRVPWWDTTFNTGQYVLRVGLGALVFRATAGTPLLTGTVTDRLLGAVGLTGLAMYTTNIVLVHAIVSIQ